MKRFVILSMAVAVFLASCGEQKKTEPSQSTPKKEEKQEVKNYQIDTSQSVVYWKGTMVGMYSHEGTLKFKAGNLTFDGNKIVDGNFTVDMTTINPTDNNYSENNPREKLIEHLSSPDFFNVKEFPTASFKVKKQEGNTITGDLTIRGKTHEEKVTDVTLSTENGVLKASGKLVFNRQKYDVSYQSTMKDMVLSDDIELKINIVANQQ